MGNTTIDGARPTPTGLAELHLHTDASDGIAGAAEMLDYVDQKTVLNVVAITDHDTVRGAREALELAAKRSYSFEIVSGVEISTNAGHLIGLFVDATVPYDEARPLTYYVKTLHSLGGLCIVPHPMSRQKNSISRFELERLLDDPDQAARPDGLEILEPRVARIMNVEDVEKLNRTQYH
ncbi:MAG: PHP domain-containing protein, partial [Chloroflexi bacterium]|nr:PHP domain-containing protein [Chloroflexota bacterium]